MITGNKGEWSELYVFLKLLGEGKLNAGDSNMNAIDGLSFPVIEVKRNDNIYQRDNNKNKINIVEEKTKKVLLSLPNDTFLEKATLLLEQIKKEVGTFNVREIETFIKDIHVLSLKASSSKKADITVVLHDIFTMQNREFDFSIKSRLGSYASLLNAGKTTNFIYKIDKKIEDIFTINNISTLSKVKDKILYLKKEHKLFFVGPESDVFDVNMQLIDSRFPEIISNMLLYYYEGMASSVKELVELLNKNNPLAFNLKKNKSLYEYKVKKFLREIALGMLPSKEWSGDLDVTGGYIVVKETGDLICYHLYNMNDFEEYLFENTKFDTPSTSKHDFGILYNEKNETFFKLNLQIRFKK